MSTLLFFIFILFIFFFVFDKCTRKYLNPYKLTLVFGKKGSGKSTLLTKIALTSLKKGYTVYTTEDIPGTYKIDASIDIGTFEFDDNSVLLCDEVGMIWDNRNFKSFKPEVRDWFKLQRHRHLIVYLFSQTFDVDKKIRDLTDEMYLVKKFMRIFTVARKIDRIVVLNNSTADSPSSIDEDLRFVPFFMPGALQFSFIPFWSKFYDSFVRAPLKIKDFKFTPLNDQTINFIRTKSPSLLAKKLSSFFMFFRVHKKM